MKKHSKLNTIEIKRVNKKKKIVKRIMKALNEGRIARPAIIHDEDRGFITTEIPFTPNDFDLIYNSISKLYKR